MSLVQRESAVQNSILNLLLIPFSGTMRPGKTTIMVYLFGAYLERMAEDRKDFEIKPMTKEGKIIERLEQFCRIGT